MQYLELGEIKDEVLLLLFVRSQLSLDAHAWKRARQLISSPERNLRPHLHPVEGTWYNHILSPRPSPISLLIINAHDKLDVINKKLMKTETDPKQGNQEKRKCLR